MNNTVMSQPLLSKHMFSCLVDKQVILLDIKNNKYLGLDQAQTEAFHTISRQVSNTEPSVKINAKNDNLSISDSITELVEKGILTTNPSEGKIPTTISLISPPLDLTGYDVKKKRRVRISHVMQLLKSVLLTSGILRFGSLEYAINRVKKRKVRNFERLRYKDNGLTEDVERIRELVEVFRLIRLFLFTSKDFCLYDSLVLIEFLSAYGILPDLVIAVKLHEFQAHAWVQDDHFIYNSCIREIDQMTPIMVV